MLISTFRVIGNVLPCPVNECTTFQLSIPFALICAGRHDVRFKCNIRFLCRRKRFHLPSLPFHRKAINNSDDKSAYYAEEMMNCEWIRLNTFWIIDEIIFLIWFIWWNGGLGETFPEILSQRRLLIVVKVNESLVDGVLCAGGDPLISLHWGGYLSQL